MPTTDPAARQKILAGGFCPDTGKIVHATKGRAGHHAGLLRRQTGYTGRPFYCPGCGGWHVGRGK